MSQRGGHLHDVSYTEKAMSMAKRGGQNWYLLETVLLHEWP